MTLRLFLLWLHLLSAAVLVGGFTFSLLLFASWKRAGQTEEQLELLQRVERGVSFSLSRAMELLLLTGIFNFVVRGMASGFHFSPAFYPVLAVKLILFLVMFVIQIVDSKAFVAKRQALVVNPWQPPSRVQEAVSKSLRRSATLKGVNLVLILIVLYLGLTLSRV